MLLKCILCTKFNSSVLTVFLESARVKINGYSVIDRILQRRKSDWFTTEIGQGVLTLNRLCSGYLKNNSLESLHCKNYQKLIHFDLTRISKVRYIIGWYTVA